MLQRAKHSMKFSPNWTHKTFHEVLPKMNLQNIHSMKFSPKWTRKTYIPWSSLQNELPKHTFHEVLPKMNSQNIHSMKFSPKWTQHPPVHCEGWMDGWMDECQVVKKQFSVGFEFLWLANHAWWLAQLLFFLFLGR